MEQPSNPTESPRPRPHLRTFSRGSDRSSDRGSNALSQVEKADKARRDSLLRGESKANPNAALAEAQPGAIAAFEHTTIDNLRAVQHKDTAGTLISEPDLSNPTRPRWERPLDTIRSFERAIDGGYKRRTISRSESYDPAPNYNASHRNSYYGGNGHNAGRQSMAGNGYYANGPRESYQDNNNGFPPNGPVRLRYSNRFPSDSAIRGVNGGYAPGYNQHGYTQSHDTVNTSVTQGSDSTGPWAASTHPSSGNSSPDGPHDRAKPPRTAQGVEGYGHDGMGGAPIPEEYASDDSMGYQRGPRRAPNGYGGGYQHNGGPAPAVQPAPRQTIQLGGGGDSSDSSAAFASQTGTLPSAARPTAQEEKKGKGWIKRRFSKNT